MKNKPVMSFQIPLCFHINTISVITTKRHFCSYPHGSNSVVAFLFQENNGNEYEKDLEMEIHLVI